MSLLEAPAIGGDRKRGPLEHASRVWAGFTRVDLARLFGANKFTRGAEIGVSEGKNALTLYTHIPNLHLTCVDPWVPYTGNPRGGDTAQHSDYFQRTQQRLRPFPVTYLCMQSLEAHRYVPDRSLDFVYIDGNHSYEYVAQDLELWSEKVRSGGIISGHDFFHFKWAGVVEAVEKFTARHRILDWYLTDEQEPSFWWVKA